MAKNNNNNSSAKSILTGEAALASETLGSTQTSQQRQNKLLEIIKAKEKEMVTYIYHHRL